MRHLYRLNSRRVLAVRCYYLPVGATGNVATGGSYHVTAYKPHDPSRVKVKLSTSTQNLFVMEGDRVLMAVQANVGKPGEPHPARPLHDLQQTKRAPPAERAGPRLPDGGPVRVRAGLWISRRICLARAAYAWLRSPPSRSGCSTLRPWPGSAPRWRSRARCPRIRNMGRLVRRLDQSRDPDPPRAQMMSPSWFNDPPGPLLVDQ